MLKCLDCGNLFENGEEKTWIESHGEKLSGCPVCCGAYEEAKACEICGSYYGMEDGEDYCNNCKADVWKRFSTFLNSEFDDDEMNILREAYEFNEL